MMQTSKAKALCMKGTSSLAVGALFFFFNVYKLLPTTLKKHVGFYSNPHQVCTESCPSKISQQSNRLVQKYQTVLVLDRKILWIMRKPIIKKTTLHIYRKDDLIHSVKPMKPQD